MSHPIGDDASTFRAKFGQGQVGMLFENSGVATTLTSNPENVINGENLGAAPLPLANPGSNSQLIIAVNANSDNIEAAKDFVRWILGDEGQTAIRAGLGASAMATDVEPDAEFLAANPWAAQFLEAAKTSRSTLVEGFETESKLDLARVPHGGRRPAGSTAATSRAGSPRCSRPSKPNSAEQRSPDCAPEGRDTRHPAPRPPHPKGPQHGHQHPRGVARSTPRAAPPKRRDEAAGAVGRFVERNGAYLFLFPAIVYLAIFTVFPLIRGLLLSFTATKLVNPAGGRGVGVENYELPALERQVLDLGRHDPALHRCSRSCSRSASAQRAPSC